MLEGNSKEKNIFGVYRGNVLAFNEINQNIYSCHISTSKDFNELCFFDYPKETKDKKRNYDACLVP